MKKLALALWMSLASLGVWAQSNAASGSADFDAERSRLSAERAAIEAQFDKDRAACYKKFAVEGCLEDLRKARRTKTDDIRRQESSINDIERQRRGAAELKKLDEKSTAARPADTAEKQDKAKQDQKDREQRAVDHTTSRDAATAKVPDNQRQFADKQKAQADEQAKAARLRAEAPANAARFQDKLRKSEEHRASRERQNAAQTKPKGAPLPTPAP